MVQITEYMFGKSKKSNPITFAIIQGSLHPQSSTLVLVEETARVLRARDIPYDLIDVRASEVDRCLIGKQEQMPTPLYDRIAKVDGYIIGIPVYGSVVSGAIKNIIEHAGEAMRGKVAGIMCSSSGTPTYPASVELIRSLSQFDVGVVQPVVHTTPESFQKGVIFDEEVKLLIQEAIDALLKRCFAQRMAKIEKDAQNH